MEKSGKTFLLKVFSLLRIGAGKENIETYKKIYQLTNPVKKLLLDKKFDLHLVKLFFLFDKKDYPVLKNIFSSYHLSYSLKREIMENLVDISRRDNLKIKDIIDNYENNFEDMMIQDYIFELRYPEYTRLLREFRIYKNDIYKKTRMDIDFNPSFEEKYLKFSFTIKNIKDYKKLVKTIEHVNFRKNLEVMLNKMVTVHSE